MDPDVTEGTGAAPAPGVDPPVVVVGAGQPVLEVGAVEHAEAAGLAPEQPGAGLAHHRVVPVDKRNGPHEPGRGRQCFEPGGLGRAGGQGLLAHHVLAGAQGLVDQADVGGIGGADMDHVDIGRLDQLGGMVSGPLGLGLVLQPLGQSEVVVRHADEHGTGGPHRPGVDAAHETGPDDGGTGPGGHCPDRSRP